MTVIDLTVPIGDRGDPHLSPLNRSGGRALNGEEQVIGTGASRWVWRIALPIHDRASARGWRSIKAQLTGRLNFLRIKVCDRYRLSAGEIGSGPVTGDVPYDDGETHDDGAGFAFPQPSTTLAADAAAGATLIEVDAGPLGGVMSAGLFFSIDDWLYQVVGWELDDDVFALTILPPLKAAASTGDEADFAGRSVWVLAGDDEGRVDLRRGRSGVAEIELIEALGRDG